MTGRGEGASRTQSTPPLRAHKYLRFAIRASRSNSAKKWPKNVCLGLSPPVFWAFCHSGIILCLVWQRGPSGRGPGAGPSIAPGPWKSACGDVRGPWRGCARASVSWFGSEVLRVNPWFLCVPATRTPGCTAQCNLRLSHANNYIDHRNDGNDRELLPFAVRSASSI